MKINEEQEKKIIDHKLDLNRIFEIYNELKKRESIPRWEAMGYGFENVQRATAIHNARLSQWENNLMSAAIEIATNEKKLDILMADTREIETDSLDDIVKEIVNALWDYADAANGEPGSPTLPWHDYNLRSKMSELKEKLDKNKD